MITQLLAICYDDETDELLFKINEPAVGIYKRRYGMIGQAMERLGQHIQRREWPHFLCERNFIHIIPKDDIIKHDVSGYKCSCCPRVNVSSFEIIHIAMDPGIPKFSDNPEYWNVLKKV